MISWSSFSSLFGVSFKLPFLARGHPDRLEAVWRNTVSLPSISIISLHAADSYSTLHLCADTRPQRCSLTYSTVQYVCFVCCATSLCLPAVGGIVPCHVARSITTRCWAPAMTKIKGLILALTKHLVYMSEFKRMQILCETNTLSLSMQS